MKSYQLFLNCFYLVLIISGISSCQFVFFDQPQPVGGKNMKKIPEEFRGVWSNIEDLKDTILISESSYTMITYNERVIKLDEEDTMSSYIIINDKIFINQDMTKGYTFNARDSFLYYLERNEYVFTLSDTALLRKANNGYLMNMKRGEWWEVVYVFKNTQGEILIFYPNYERMQELKDEIEYDLIAQLNDKARDITSNDTVIIHTAWKAKDIEILFPLDSLGLPLYILQPDSLFLNINQISNKESYD